MRFVVEGCRLAVVATAVFTCAAMPPTQKTPRAAVTGDEVYDAQAYWHFARIDGVYSVESRSLVCVQKSDGQWDCWDPKHDILLGTKNLSCLPPMGTRVQDISVALAPPPGAAYSLETQASFSDGGSIHREGPDFAHCDSVFSHFYTVARAGSDGVWFVPAELLQPALDRAGADFVARERAVEQVLFTRR